MTKPRRLSRRNESFRPFVNQQEDTVRPHSGVMAFLSIYYLLYADKVTISTFLSAAKASAPASPCNIFADVQSGSERFIAKLDID